MNGRVSMSDMEVCFNMSLIKLRFGFSRVTFNDKTYIEMSVIQHFPTVPTLGFIQLHYNKNNFYSNLHLGSLRENSHRPHTLLAVRKDG